MTEKSDTHQAVDPVQKEADRLRKKFSSSEETTFTVQRATLGDGDIESVAVTFTVPSSALLDKMVVTTGAARSQRRHKDPFWADNDDGTDAFNDGGPEHGGDLPH
ncbi:hypothetical protein [Mycobacterium sp. DL99]|uniref:hypothetical protein n=1 Tax=Mycobacterium sp. DL99 TaxID=2528957 RepID=UPI001082169A|nr:hypothetical protein [Mycobacterium sp. DL99]